MTLRLYTQSYGSPGDVEHFDVSVPATVPDWIKLTEEAFGKTNFVEATLAKDPSGTLAAKKAAVNVALVERAVQV